MATVEEKDDVKTISLPNARKITREEKKALETQEDAKKIKVRSAMSYAAAAEFVLAVKERERSINDLFEVHVKNAHKAHKDLTEARGKLLKPLESARKTVEAMMSDYDREQRRLAQAKADEDARLQREQEIAEAKKRRDKEAVKELQAAPIISTPAFIPTPQVAGIVSKPIVKYRIVDESKIPRAFLMIDDSKIKAFIKQNGSAGSISGIEFYDDIQTQTRG